MLGTGLQQINKTTGLLTTRHLLTTPLVQLATKSRAEAHNPRVKFALV